jgi:GNAT superfamily N-acetyltransferase
MQVSRAGKNDLADLARLLWLDTMEEQPAPAELEAFTADLDGWWAAHRQSHGAFVARVAEPGIVGMAWVALLPRVPRPGAVDRLSADIQSVFVVPDHRGQGIGSAVVDAAARYATGLGATRVTVHSGRRAVPVYERLGFKSSRRLLQRPPDP